MSTFRKTAIALAVTALASSSVGQAESLGYYGYDATGFNNFGGPGYSDGAYAPGVPVGYGDNGYVRQAQGYEPGAQGYGSGFDQPPPHAGFGGSSFGVYDSPVYGAPGYGDPRQGNFAGYGAPQFDAYPYTQNGAQNGTPFPAYGNFNPAQAPYGPPPPGYGNSYSYNQAQPSYPGFADQNNWGNGPGMGRWIDGPWNYGGTGFDNYGPGYGPSAMSYGLPPGYAEYSHGQQPAYGYGTPEFYNNGYYGQPYVGFGGPANWSNGWYGNPGNSGWSGASWGSTPSDRGNGYEGYNYGPNNGRSNGNGWGFQHGWG